MRGARGERTIRTEDGDVRVLYTNRALAEAEAAMGKSIIAVAQGFADGETSIGEVAQLLQAGMEAARHDARDSGRRITMNDAFKAMDEAGFPQVAEAVMTAVADVLSYDPDSEDEPADPNA